MIRLTRAHVQPIALDIGQDSVKMLQLEVVGGGLSVVAAARQPLPTDVRSDPGLRVPAAVEIVRTMLRGGGFAGRNVVALMPREIVHIKNLRMPPMPLSELESAVRFEARNILPFDADGGRIHCLPAGEVRQGASIVQEVLVVAAAHNDIDNYVEQLHRCGAEVVSLDPEPCALFRSVERFIRRREDEQEVHVLVDIGLRTSRVLIGRARDISFYKPLDIAAYHLHEAVGKKLGLPVEEAAELLRRLATGPDDPERRDPVRQAVHDAIRSLVEQIGREISLCLRYHSVTFRGQRPARVRLLGGGGCDAQLQSILAAVLPIPTEVGKPLFSVNTSKMKPADRVGTMAQWATAVGLALKMTNERFGARDGKPRDPSAPRPDLSAGEAAAGSTVQTVDIGKILQELPAVSSGANVSTPSHAAQRAPALQEVAHA